jgi:hypothetical protein
MLVSAPSPDRLKNPGSRLDSRDFVDIRLFMQILPKSHAGRPCPETIPVPTSLK